MKNFLIFVVLTLLSWGASQCKADSLQSASILNNYGSVVPAGLIGVNPQSGNAQLMDTRNGGTAHVSNAQLQFACSFSPDWRDEAIGKSGKTKIIIVTNKEARSLRGGIINYIPLQLHEQPNFPKVIGTATVFSREGKSNDTDLSTLRADFAAYLQCHFENITYISRADFIATSYGVGTKGTGGALSGALSTIFSGITGGTAGGMTQNSGSAVIIPSVSISYLIFSNE